MKTRKTTNVLRKSKLEEEGAILEEKLEAINEELENVENELERDENLTDTISTNLKEFVRSSEKALKGFQKLFLDYCQNLSLIFEETNKQNQQLQMLYKCITFYRKINL